MQSYLESLPSYTDGAPPWTPTTRAMELRLDHLSAIPKVPPRDPKEFTR